MSQAVPLKVGMEPYPGYHLRQLIGRGGFAEVWEAETATKEIVALKFLPCSDNLAASREIRSIQMVRNLRHPHLIRIEQVWCHLGYIVVAMELADGSLQDLLFAYQSERNAPIDREHVLYHLAQASEAIDFLNTRQHVLNGQRVAFQHCDVKPSNLLLFGETVKVADFGLASQTSSPLKPHRRAGTMEYTAPEVFQGRLSDWTDQYAMAVTYCLLRGGQMPFADSPAKFGKDSKDYTRPTPDLSMLPEKERPIVARSLSAIPQQRWESCRDLIAQLAKVMVD